MNETSKATKRRKSIKFWSNILKGKTIDIGPGNDPLRKEDWPNITELILFDIKDGDGKYLSNYFPKETFDTIHASQMLEDVDDVSYTLGEWAKCLKSSGYIVITVPDFVLYEQLQWPSVYNQGHKKTFSLYLKGSPAGDSHWHIGSQRWNRMLESVGLRMDYAALKDTNYDYSKLGSKVDQTLNADDGVECFIEVLLSKQDTSDKNRHNTFYEILRSIYQPSGTSRFE